ncbi:MAG: diacylglycerol/lipid kinase family protein [Longimicrobiales bacterium]
MERSSPGELYIVLNPKSGSGAGAHVRAEVERELARRGLRFRIDETRGPGHATQLALDAVRAGETTIVAAGGDGTIHEVANGILSANQPARATLGLIPIGTGNDFVKVVPGTTPRSRAYDTLARGHTRRFDAGRVRWQGGEEWFVNGMGTGIDVEVVRQIERSRNLPAVLVYIVGLVKALARYRPMPLRLTMDGLESERRVMMAAVTNGACIGGSFHVCPGARPDDGWLNVCIVDELRLPGILRVVARILRGAHRGSRAVEMRQARTVTIRSSADVPLFFQLDGELREPADAWSIHVSIDAGALPVVAEPVTGATSPAEGSTSRASVASAVESEDT